MKPDSDGEERDVDAQPRSHFAPRCLCVDIEVGVENSRIRSIAAIRAVIPVAVASRFTTRRPMYAARAVLPAIPWLDGRDESGNRWQSDVRWLLAVLGQAAKPYELTSDIASACRCAKRKRDLLVLGVCSR